MKHRQDYFDFAKGTSIILVVLFHSTIALDYYDLVSPKYWLLNNFMAPIRMPVFFFISGFLAKGALNSFDEGKFSNKVYNLIYIFAVWTTIHFSWKLLYPFSPAPEMNDLISSAYSPSSVLWFIWALSIYFCVARTGHLFNKEVVFSLSIIFSLMICAEIFEFENYVHNNLLRFLPIFLFGAWYSEKLLTSPVFFNSASLAISLMAFIALFVITYRDNIPSAWSGVGILIGMILGVVVGLTTSAFLCRFTTISKLPTFIGRNTLSIYVAHSPIVGFLADIIALRSYNTAIIPLVGVPLVSITAIFMSFFLKNFLQRIGLWWLYKFPGKRMMPLK